jgi:hypothetical protein
MRQRLRRRPRRARAHACACANSRIPRRESMRRERPAGPVGDVSGHAGRRRRRRRCRFSGVSGSEGVCGYGEFFLPWVRGKNWISPDAPCARGKKDPARLPQMPAGEAESFDRVWVPHTFSLCSLGLSATSQQYFSLTTNQPPATSQQYSSLRTN